MTTDDDAKALTRALDMLNTASRAVYQNRRLRKAREAWELAMLNADETLEIAGWPEPPPSPVIKTSRRNIKKGE